MQTNGDDADGKVLSSESAYMQALGHGAAGVIYATRNHRTGYLIVIKVYREAEVVSSATAGVIQTIRGGLRNAPRTTYIGAFLDDGYINGHFFITLPLYGLNLRQVMMSNELFPLPANHVKAVAYQLLTAVEFLGSLGLVHTDIKPENIVLCHNTTVVVKTFHGDGLSEKTVLQSPEIRLIDCDGAQSLSPNPVQRYLAGTCQYRAPEISMEMPWSAPVDVFSIGCVLFELQTRTCLLHPTDCVYERLADIEARLGRLPDEFVLQLPTRTRKHLFPTHAGVESVEDNTRPAKVCVVSNEQHRN
ncbi:kinase-like domain-containing protein [Ephemerocybe angulata]|uniref:Kinase-like domain-containing protein n=1 Tax=Ephemerocybe angulata TaxID=980116 RepID=A0A8H6HFT1_9AGAR|nr:kinase-like domain-containing protein [Tulosesus angulatus]